MTKQRIARKIKTIISVSRNPLVAQMYYIQKPYLVKIYRSSLILAHI